MLPFALTLAAAACWARGNLVGKCVGRVDPLAFIVWSSLAAPAPMFALSLWFEDGQTLPALMHPTLRLALAVAVLSYGGTLFGFGLWSRLLIALSRRDRRAVRAAGAGRRHVRGVDRLRRDVATD